MVTMILKMTGMASLYVLLTSLLWRLTRNKRLSLGWKLFVGVIYGLCSVLSTHYGVDYGHMMLNVRDIGPLAAGLFFHPLSGIIAGLIGGIERYIAGTYWNVGAYTRIACSVSTCLAGFVAAIARRYFFHRKNPFATHAFFLGAVMEVFHMYVVLITHRSDMDMAFYVVRTCSAPMIVFTGLGMAGSAIAVREMAGEWRNPLRRVKGEELTLSYRFQSRLFVVVVAVLMITFGFSFAIQAQTSLQAARGTLADVSEDISQTYDSVHSTQQGIAQFSQSLVLREAWAISRTVELTSGIEHVEPDFLQLLRDAYGLKSVCLVSMQGELICAAGDKLVYYGMLDQVFTGAREDQVAQPSSMRAVAGVRCGEGVVQAVIDTDSLSQTLNQAALDETLSLFHVGSEGCFDIISTTGFSVAGAHKDKIMPEWAVARQRLQAGETVFEDVMFGVKSICRVERLSDGAVLLALLPMREVYANRDAQALETALADILLFTVVYAMITLLVRLVVVNDLDRVNESLGRITSGDLNEVVDVRNSSEFASLSDDINRTVTVLKGYIAAAEKRIEQELELARAIQDAALPKNFSFPRQDFEIYALMDPAKEVGGDFYDFFFVDSDRLALVIADVSGKGIPASLFMMRARTAIRSLAGSGSTPSEILYRANNTLCEGNDAEMFVTAWIGIIDLRTGEMCCANAGHEYPMLMRAGERYELFKDKHGMALAAMEEIRFKEYTLQLAPGDRLFVYTDGIPEAIDPQTQQYGVQRLEDRLNALRDVSMAELLPAVRADVAAFAGDSEQFDDITMLGFVYRGTEGSDKL